MRVATQIGQNFFYSLKRIPIEMSMIHFNDDCCRGVQDDRQKDDEHCSCIRFPTRQGMQFVMSCTIKFPVPRSFNNNEYAQADFQSLKLTKLFFDDFNMFSAVSNMNDILSKLQTFRAQIRSMVDEVNNNGGWEILGWYKAGGVSDAATDDSKERVVNTYVNMHISALRPSNSAVLESPDFEALKIAQENWAVRPHHARFFRSVSSRFFRQT